MNQPKVILITGASSGIGKICAEYLSGKGYKVYGTSRKPNAKKATYEMIQMDVNDDDMVKEGIAYILKKEGRLDVVVNNAGIGIAGSVEDSSIEEMKFQFETNFFGTIRVCQSVLPVMRKQQYGYIINIGSIAGLIGVPFQSAYSASKSAIHSLTEVMRMELRPFGIHAVLIQPGDYKTGFSDSRIRTKQSTNPVYIKNFNTALQVMEAEERNGNEPKVIALLIDKIINNSSPRLRYITGPKLQILAVHLRKFLPSKLFEWIIRSNYQI